MSLSTNHVEFDNISLGEMQARTVKVLNNGGLESNLDLRYNNAHNNIVFNLTLILALTTNHAQLIVLQRDMLALVTITNPLLLP